MPFVNADAVRNVGELTCDCQAAPVVQLHEDGDRQDDGTILWSGNAMGDCPSCGQTYADWWEGIFKIGAPTACVDGGYDTCDMSFTGGKCDVCGLMGGIHDDQRGVANG